MTPASWSDLLFKIGLVVTVGANTIVLYYVFPAFRSTKKAAFLFLIVASVLGIVDTVFDHTIAIQQPKLEHYLLYATIRRFTYFISTILLASGVVLLSRSILTPCKPKDT